VTVDLTGKVDLNTMTMGFANALGPTVRVTA